MNQFKKEELLHHTLCLFVAFKSALEESNMNEIGLVEVLHSNHDRISD